MVETEILTKLFGKERCGRVRGVGLGPTPKSYYENTTSKTFVASSTQSSVFVERFHQMEQQMQLIKEEPEQNSIQYNAFLGFLQNQFPRVTINEVNIGGSTSESQVFRKCKFHAFEN